MKHISYRSAGTMVNRYKYNAGNEYEDEGELNYSNTFYRKYDAQIGRFTGIDMLAEKFAGINPYQYGANNPVMFNDPSGDKFALNGRLQKGEDGRYHPSWYNDTRWGGADGDYNTKGDGGESYAGGAGAGSGSGSGEAGGPYGAYWLSMWNNAPTGINTTVGTFDPKRPYSYINSAGTLMQTNVNHGETYIDHGREDMGYISTYVVFGAPLPAPFSGAQNSGGNWLSAAGKANDYGIGSIGAFGTGTMSKEFIIGAAMNAQVEGRLTDRGVNALAKVGNFTQYGKLAAKAGPLVGVGIGAFKVYNGYIADGNSFGIHAQTATAVSVGSVVGGYVGAEGGAAIGAGIGVWFGGVGAVPGAIIGGIIGAIGGSWGGEKAGEAFMERK